MTRRKIAMMKASHQISGYLAENIELCIDGAIELYIRDHYYPEMNVKYRRKFLKLATKIYPPEFTIELNMKDVPKGCTLP